jgi:hypothetical protein
VHAGVKRYQGRQNSGYPFPGKKGGMYFLLALNKSTGTTTLTVETGRGSTCQAPHPFLTDWVEVTVLSLCFLFHTSGKVDGAGLVVHFPSCLLSCGLVVRADSWIWAGQAWPWPCGQPSIRIRNPNSFHNKLCALLPSSHRTVTHCPPKPQGRRSLE